MNLKRLGVGRGWKGGKSSSRGDGGEKKEGGGRCKRWENHQFEFDPYLAH